MATYNTETLTSMKTTDLRKLAGKEFGIKGMSSARKADLVPAILEELARRATITGANVNDRAHRTDNGTVKGQKCAECGKRPVDKKTQGRDSTMCRDCFEYAGWENTHSDEDHEGTENLALREGCPVCEKAGLPTSRPAGDVSPKALAFEADAKKAGWSALARLSADGGISLVTARASDGRELELRWAGKVCVDGQNFLKRADGKRVKVRNASAARKILTEG
jgi:hypothetical protein